MENNIESSSPSTTNTTYYSANKNKGRTRGITFELFIIYLTSASIFLILMMYIYQPIDTVSDAIYLFDFIVSAILSIDFYKRAKDSKQGLRFVLNHCYEIPALIPMYGFVLLGTETVYGAATKSLRLVQIFRFVHLLSRTTIISDRINNRLIYAVILSISIITVGALSMFVVEHNATGSRINSLGDAFWWSIVTFTTVGYGDIYPITLEGRIIDSIIMIVGIAILGILISALGAGLIESKMKNQYKKEQHAVKSLIKDKIDRLEHMQKEEINSLLNLITNLHGEIGIKYNNNNNPSIEEGENINELNDGDGDGDRVKCLKCNNINPQESIYCNRCGHSLH